VIIQQYKTADHVDVTAQTCNGTGATVTVSVTVTTTPIMLPITFSRTVTETANVVCGSATQRGNC
jgi:hypothetical protein